MSLAPDRCAAFSWRNAQKCYATLTLPKDLLRQLNTRCKKQDLNRSQLIRKTIRAHQLQKALGRAQELRHGPGS